MRSNDFKLLTAYGRTSQPLSLIVLTRQKVWIEF